MPASGSETKKKRKTSEVVAEALTPAKICPIHRSFRGRLGTTWLAMLSLTLVRLDFAILEPLDSDHPTLCQDTKISFLDGRREIMYLQVGFL